MTWTKEKAVAHFHDYCYQRVHRHICTSERPVIDILVDCPDEQSPLWLYALVEVEGRIELGSLLGDDVRCDSREAAFDSMERETTWIVVEPMLARKLLSVLVRHLSATDALGGIVAGDLL